ncbi:flavin reductase family protein [Pseudodonghicola xiamenensis]|uniref:FMN reductase (NADH) RutF n=1 Tax=Pseudodonghicola xiamenensis TaxID=337702 RepID=A0A8J3H6Z8_9RHOB|nr:flavin reductase family protein [Pseudodonghicola xiamenensis]GHG85782.1 FMN reductase (NADH) RutF [Pseudodonghicola xiamenensis]
MSESKDVSADCAALRSASASLRSDFRDAMASLAAKVCIVAARGAGQCFGRTVTAAFSLNVAPPAILVSIAAGAPLAALIRAGRQFSVAMLSEGQQAVADAFAGKVAPEHRFEVGDWQSWSSGQPRLAGGVAAMDCTVISEIELADHLLFAGAPRDIRHDGGRQPLVWHGRHYNGVCTL